MLSIGKLAPGQEEYYTQMVALGVEDYYLGAREAPGQWMGLSAHRLGLDGEVDPDDLRAVLARVDPSQRFRLTGGHSQPKIAGFDATHCAPKGVSLLFALGNPETSNEVRNAHDASVSAAVGVLENEAARARRGRGGAVRVAAEGFVAAAFRHRTSRAADPQLHTHVLVANVVYSPGDGRWSALDARPLYAWASTVGYLYEAHLRSELTRRLGVEWETVHNGMADIKGIPRHVLRAFSTRREEIERHLAETGEAGARAAQRATYHTRRRKDPNIDVEGLAPGWRRKAAELGFDDTVIAGLLHRVSPPRLVEPESERAGELFEWLASPDGLTRRASTFGRREVIRAICEAMPAGAPVDTVLGLTDAFLASEHVVGLGPVQRLRCSDVIQRRDGAVVASHTDELRWTTPEMLTTERRLIDAAMRRRAESVAVVQPETVRAALTRRPGLSAEQQHMVSVLTGSGAGVDVVEGLAGSGKTRALDAATEAWTADGYRVLGAALAARAANELEVGAGIPALTIDRLLRRLDRADIRLDPRTVLVVDEAAMVGTRKLARLLERAEEAGAKVVLVGDRFQLPEIDAGGAFAGLARHLGAVSLTTNRRQTQAWEQGALAELRSGDTDLALEAYQARERVHTADTPADAHRQLVDDWWAARQSGQRPLMVAAHLRDVDHLNQLARALLQGYGELPADGVAIGDRRFAVGDEVLALRNDYRIGILNGTRGVVRLIDQHRQVLSVDPDRRAVDISFAYAAQWLTHGYATTIHKAQAATVDRTLFLADDTLGREHSYSALSRGSERNDIYVAADDPRAEVRHSREAVPGPADALKRAFNRSNAKTLASDSVGDWMLPGSQLDALRHEQTRLDGVLRRTRPPDPRREVRGIDQDLRRARERHKDARWRREHALSDLDALGPLGRLARRRQRHDIENRLHHAENDLQRQADRIDELTTARDRVLPKLTCWQQWESDHACEIARLDTVNLQLRLATAAERAHARNPQPSLDRGLAIEL